MSFTKRHRLMLVKYPRSIFNTVLKLNPQRHKARIIHELANLIRVINPLPNMGGPCGSSAIDKSVDSEREWIIDPST